MTTMQQLLEQDGHLGFNLAIHKRFSSIGDSAYTEICGGFIEGVYQWATHNISDVIESSNDKYTGWTIHFEGGTTRRVYIPNWVMSIIPTGWGHAKNIFSKYLIEDHKYNSSEGAQGHRAHHWD